MTKKWTNLYYVYNTYMLTNDKDIYLKIELR